MVSCEIGRELQTREVCLKEEEGFKVWSLEIDTVNFDRDTVVDAAKKGVLMPSDRNALELCRGRNDLQNTLELRTLLQRESIDFDGDIYSLCQPIVLK